MHEKHIDQLSLLQARRSQCQTGQHENKEEGKTQNAP